MNSFIFVIKTPLRVFGLAFLGGAVLACAPAATVSQDSIPYPSANNLSVKVKAAATAIGGDTIRVNYSLHNDPTSVQKAQFLVVRTNANAIGHVGTPGMRLGWVASAQVLRDSASVHWFAADEFGLVTPADSAAPFYFTAVGVVGIVRFYVQGFVPIPEYTAAAERTKAPLPIWQDSYKGWTIAVVPFPTNMTPLGLVQRLESLTDEACSLGWVAEPGICNSLEAKRRAARRAIERGDLPAACNHINALLNELNALPDSKIAPEGRSLLRLNAHHLVRMHCGG